MPGPQTGGTQGDKGTTRLSEKGSRLERDFPHPRHGQFWANRYGRSRRRTRRVTASSLEAWAAGCHSGSANSGPDAGLSHRGRRHPHPSGQHAGHSQRAGSHGGRRPVSRVPSPPTPAPDALHGARSRRLNEKLGSQHRRPATVPSPEDTQQESLHTGDFAFL